ncbi:TetR/AcrR family transcriptional regulator [Cupriavidus necator]|uniref:TetR/AcrR family transcriptional regulator n=1 Tax=Cupriavidus necator TaxID=106590 RepID=A0A367PI80_CUPNE|nr:TetR/AcrR family transcriptional regulator [Cupriavidus necator]QQX86609.1 TetR/AcrR family transcriptional regulator [Cupriavidus necator]RCJ06805.1 TetR/AcrR family transcriptional regulator [Cupriavidus necator]
MGHSQTQKQHNHERIVQLAAQRFRELGIDGLSIANLMKEAGLTHGGFYKHFESRDDLVAQAVGAALAGSESTRRASKADTFSAFVESYLSKRHRDKPGQGCAIGALANDMSRAPEDARTLYTAQLCSSLDHVAELLDTSATTAEANQTEAIVAFSTMVGALVLARAVNDPALSEQILSTVRDHLL